MSYILDALKKSEQERFRDVAPTLHTIHAVPYRKSQLTPWHYGAIAAAVVAAAAILWQRPWQARSSSPLPQVAFLPAPPSMPAPAGDTAPAVRPAAVNLRPALPRPHPVIARAERHQPPAPAKEKPEPAKPAMEAPVAAAVPAPVALAQPIPLREAHLPAPEPLPAKPPGEPAARPSSRQEILDISELPPAVQRSLPKLTISGYINHADTAAGRMVGIGEHALSEGDEVAPGLKLERIADTAAIFAYKGYRFRVSLP